VQVQDHDKIWRTIFVTHISAFPLTFVGRIGLPRVEEFLATYLAEVLLGDRRNTAISTESRGTAQIEASLDHNKLQTFADNYGLIQSEIHTVDLLVTSKSNLII